MLVISLSLAWLAGILVGGLNQPLPVFSALGAVVAGCGFLWRRGRLPLFYLPLVAGVALLGSLRYQTQAEALANDPLADLRGAGSVSLRGLVVREPEAGDTTARWALQVEASRKNRGESWGPRSGLVMVYSRWLPRVRYGDWLELDGKLERPPRFESFDYQEYLARQGVHALLRYPRVQVLGHGRGNGALQLLYELRERLDGALEAALPEPQGALARGILLGKRAGIPEEVREEFKRTGTTHILAISGHNLSVLAGMLVVGGTLAFGGRNTGYILGLLLALWGYAVVAGFVPSVVRAAFMASFVLFARLVGRQSYPVLTLSLAAAVMALVDPLLLWDVGFQLSFLAMAGILLGVPLLEVLANRVPTGGWRVPVILGVAVQAGGTALGATLGATAGTLPVQLVAFGSLPLAALPATLFALPALPPVLVAALVTALVGLLAPPLATIPASVTWLFSSYMLQVVHWWAQVPGSFLQFTPLGALWGWAYAAALALVLAAGYRWLRVAPTAGAVLPRPLFALRSNGSGLSGTALLWGPLALLLTASAGVWALALSGPEEGLRVRFLDVRQGDAILLESSAGQRVLIDGGPSPGMLLAQLGSALPFWDRYIELAVLTHPQRDHITGLLGLLERHGVGAVLESGLTGATQDYAEWERLLRAKGIQRIIATAGTRVYLKDAVIEVLHPQVEELPLFARTPNEGSLVLAVSSFEAKVLLTGDIEEMGERALLKYRDALPSSVLKVPHHGSKTSTSQAFLDAVAPRVAVLSLGAGNPYGHPSAEVLDRLRGTTLLRTDHHGTINLRLDRRGVLVATEKPLVPH